MASYPCSTHAWQHHLIPILSSEHLSDRFIHLQSDIPKALVPPKTDEADTAKTDESQAPPKTDQSSTLPHHDNPASCSSDALQQHLDANKAWASNFREEHPELLDELSKGQSPTTLWIGCSDSRVPETTLLNAKPGDVFVHRNIANVLHVGDISATAVITYAVVHLKVKQVVLSGHTLCGGVNAALGNSRLGLLDTWLLPIRRLRKELAKGEGWDGLSPEEKSLKLVEANVKRGVEILHENADIIEAAKTRGLKVHGVVYDIKTGHLNEVDCGEDESDKHARLGAFGMES